MCFAFIIVVFLITSIIDCNAGICWRRKNLDGTCSGFRGFYQNRADCCARGGLAFSKDNSRKAILIQLFVDRPPCQLCNNPCSKIFCESGWVCQVSKSGLPGCHCKPDCTELKPGPVCGSDGRTYSSRCALQRLACQRGRIDVEYYGKCKKNCVGVSCAERQICIADKTGNSYCIDTHCPTVCPRAVNKVCGTDGRTYMSKCVLKKASCVKGRKIDFAYVGDCRAKSSCKDVKCPKNSSCVLDINGQPRCQNCGCPFNNKGLPVCGSDGKKYRSWCHMRQYSCSIGKVIRVNPNLKC